MVYLKNVLEAINTALVLPVVIVTFILLISIFLFLRKKDPDVLRSRIFLKYGEFKNAFLLFVVFAFFLILHVSLIYIPRFLSFYDPLIELIQEFFGLCLVLTLLGFVGIIYKSLKL